MIPSAALLALSEQELRTLGGAFRTGRISLPLSEGGLDRYLPHSRSVAACGALRACCLNGATARTLADTLDLLADSQAGHVSIEDAAQLVMTGPEDPGIENRETFVVVQELFHQAKRSVLVAGFKVYSGGLLFRPLAERMRDVSGLDVRFFLDLPEGSTPRSFVTDFAVSNWPHGFPLPAIFFDRRAVEPVSEAYSALHAKCVIVDEEALFVSSANFSFAAQMRNIELGVLLRSTQLAQQATRFFDGLVEAGHCLRADA